MVTSPHARPDTPGQPGRRPSHIADLLRLLVRDPGRPRLTWYGDDGERVELSGAVLENWVNKTTNLLVEEFDAAPSACVIVDLGVHWRAVVWALALWRTGATLVVASPESPPEAGPGAAPGVVVTSRPGAWAATDADLVAVSLPALARRFDGELPRGALDAASGVMTYGDQVGWVPDVDLAAPALVREGSDDVTHRDLLDHVDAAPDRAPGARVLVRGDGEPGATLRTVLDVLADDGSVVLCSPGRTRALDADPASRARLVETERVTAD